MPTALGIQKSLQSLSKCWFFSDGPSANPHSFGLAGFKLRDNGTGHILDKIIKSGLIKSSWFLFPRNTFTFLSVMGFRYHDSYQNVLLFPFRARKIDFFLGRLSAVSLSEEIISTTLLKACGIKNHSRIYLHLRLMEEYYYPETSSAKESTKPDSFCPNVILSLLLKWHLPRDHVLNKYK